MTEGHVNPIKPKFMYIIFENSLFTTQKTAYVNYTPQSLNALRKKSLLIVRIIWGT